MSRMLHRRALILNGLSIAICVAGCNKGPSVEFAPVQGTVKMNGQPQRAIGIQLTPDREKGSGVPALAYGTSDDQGKYTLKYSYQGKGGDGAAVGWYRATLVDTGVGMTRQGEQPKPSAIPSTYSMPATTPLLVEVKPGENTIDLEVKR